MRLGAAALALAIAMPAVAQAEAFYVKLEGGASWAADAHLTDRIPSTGMIADSSGTPNHLDNLGEAWFAGIGVGYRISDMFRVDLTYTRRAGYELDDTAPNAWHYQANVTSDAVMANLYFDVPFKLGPVQPFVGGGLGWARNELDTVKFNRGSNNGTDPSGTSDNLAWQLTAGGAVELGNGFTLDIAYRYFDGGEVGGNAGKEYYNGAYLRDYGGSRGSLTAHEAMAGLRYSF